MVKMGSRKAEILPEKRKLFIVKKIYKKYKKSLWFWGRISACLPSGIELRRDKISKHETNKKTP